MYVLNIFFLSIFQKKWGNLVSLHLVVFYGTLSIYWGSNKGNLNQSPHNDVTLLNVDDLIINIQQRKLYIQSRLATTSNIDLNPEALKAWYNL